MPSDKFFSQLSQSIPNGRSRNEVEEYAEKVVKALECAWTYAVGKAEKNFLRFNAPPKFHRKFREFEE